MIIIELLENINEIGEKIRNIDFKEMQENFLESTIGKIANSALDTGLKSLLPDFLEKEIIDVKDTILKEGFSEGVNKAIETATNLGKSAMGIFTGNFESIEQAEKVLEKGGLLETISDGLDYVIEKLEDSKIRESALTLSPDSKRIISPITKERGSQNGNFCIKGNCKQVCITNFKRLLQRFFF